VESAKAVHIQVVFWYIMAYFDSLTCSLYPKLFAYTTGVSRFIAQLMQEFHRRLA
jgi:hypothetical protein